MFLSRNYLINLITFINRRRISKLAKVTLNANKLLVDVQKSLNSKEKVSILHFINKHFQPIILGNECYYRFKDISAQKNKHYALYIKTNSYLKWFVTFINESNKFMQLIKDNLDIDETLANVQKVLALNEDMLMNLQNIHYMNASHK